MMGRAGKGKMVTRVIITGGARGIGAAVARGFAAAGAHVALMDLRVAEASALAASLGEMRVPDRPGGAAAHARVGWAACITGQVPNVDGGVTIG